MAELSDILDSENIVLVDGCIKSRSNNDFTWEIYDAKNYSELDKDLIEKEIFEIETFSGILAVPNTYTISEVTEEIKSFEEVLNRKIKFMPFIKSRISNRRKKQIKIANKKPKELLHRLQEEVYRTRRLSSSKEIHKSLEFEEINSQRYNLLLNMTKLITRELNLKRDTSYLIGERDRDTSKESDTDERLVATLYWLSLFDKSSWLLSQDMDFVRLLGVVTRLIGSDSFLPYNEEFRKKLTQNQFKLYLRNIKTKEYELKIQSSKIIYDNEFKIRTPTSNKSEKIKQEISQMWGKFEHY